MPIKKPRRWSESPHYALTVFLVCVVVVATAKWAFQEYRQRRAAAELAEMTQHYEQEIRKQMDAVQAATPPAASQDGAGVLDEPTPRAK